MRDAHDDTPKADIRDKQRHSHAPKRSLPRGFEPRRRVRKSPATVVVGLLRLERTTGLEPATPTLARLYSTPEPLAHLLIFILLSARCTLQMILYRNSPHLSIPIFNFFQKKSKVSTIPSIFALHQTPAQLSSPHKFTPNHPPDESRLLSIRPPNPTCSRRSASWRIQTLYPRPHRQTSRGFVPAVQRA